MQSTPLNICMSNSKSFTQTIKDALAKKHAAQHPDAKTSAQDSKKLGGSTAPKGPPTRRNTSRGG